MPNEAAGGGGISFALAVFASVMATVITMLSSKVLARFFPRFRRWRGLRQERRASLVSLLARRPDLIILRTLSGIIYVLGAIVASFLPGVFSLMVAALLEFPVSESILYSWYEALAVGAAIIAGVASIILLIAAWDRFVLSWKAQKLLATTLVEEDSLRNQVATSQELIRELRLTRETLRHGGVPTTTPGEHREPPIYFAALKHAERTDIIESIRSRGVDEAYIKRFIDALRGVDLRTITQSGLKSTLPDVPDTELVTVITVLHRYLS